MWVNAYRPRPPVLFGASCSSWLRGACCMGDDWRTRSLSSSLRVRLVGLSHTGFVWAFHLSRFVIAFVGWAHDGALWRGRFVSVALATFLEACLSFPPSLGARVPALVAVCFRGARPRPIEAWRVLWTVLSAFRPLSPACKHLPSPLWLGGGGLAVAERTNGHPGTVATLLAISSALKRGKR